MDLHEEMATVALGALVRRDRQVVSDRAVLTRLKELITVALQSQKRCEQCRRVHHGCAREARAAPEEVAQTVTEATPDEGGPACGWSRRTVARLNPGEPT